MPGARNARRTTREQTMSKLVHKKRGQTGLVLTAARLGTEAAVEGDFGFHPVLEFLPDAALAVDVNGVVIAWNPAMEQLTGIPAVDMIGQGDYAYGVPYYGYRRPMLVDLILKPSRVLEKNYPYLMRDGETLQTELFVPALRPSGRHLSIKASPLRDNSGRLVGAIETTRDISEMKRLERELLEAKSRLEREQGVLEQKNAALQEILNQIETEKQLVIARIRTNVDRLVRPLLRQLGHRVGSDDQTCLAEIGSRLDEIAEPFAHRLESRFATLSPRQVEICNNIRRGLSCKEIARQFDTSVHTVLNQRQDIRRKLGLNGQRVNLMSFLRSL